MQLDDKKHSVFDEGALGVFGIYMSFVWFEREGHKSNLFRSLRNVEVSSASTRTVFQNGVSDVY